MWIRSQDKTDLIDAKRISVSGKRIINAVLDDDYDILGEYETKERAIKVLDKIQHQMENVTCANNIYDDGQTISHSEVVFQMPKESEL
jgi:hypothetical protein